MLDAPRFGAFGGPGFSAFIASGLGAFTAPRFGAFMAPGFGGGTLAAGCSNAFFVVEILSRKIELLVDATQMNTAKVLRNTGLK